MPESSLVVELKAIQDRVKEAAEFLKSRVEGKIRTRGTRVEIAGARTKNVKLLLHKFLHHQGLNDYRVHIQDGILEIAPPEGHRVHRQDSGGTSPTAPQTMPYYFPQSTASTPQKKPKKMAKRE